MWVWLEVFCLLVWSRLQVVTAAAAYVSSTLVAVENFLDDQDIAALKSQLGTIHEEEDAAERLLKPFVSQRHRRTLMSPVSETIYRKLKHTVESWEQQRLPPPGDLLEEEDREQQCTTNDSDNIEEDTLLPLTTLFTTTQPHKDQKPEKVQQDQHAELVAALVFLDDNEDAGFVHGLITPTTSADLEEETTMVRAKKGRLVLFDGSILHHTIVPQGSRVRLLGPVYLSQEGRLSLIGCSNPGDPCADNCCPGSTCNTATGDMTCWDTCLPMGNPCDGSVQCCEGMVCFIGNCQPIPTPAPVTPAPTPAPVTRAPTTAPVTPAPTTAPTTCGKGGGKGKKSSSCNKGNKEVRGA